MLTKELLMARFALRSTIEDERAVFFVNQHREIVLCSRAFSEVFDRKPTDMFGVHVSEFIREKMPLPSLTDCCSKRDYVKTWAILPDGSEKELNVYKHSCFESDDEKVFKFRIDFNSKN